MTPNPAALAVLLDAARACYGDDAEQVRWLLHPDAAASARAQLSRLTESERVEFFRALAEGYCTSCGTAARVCHCENDE